jgi:hypothetical protein
MRFSRRHLRALAGLWLVLLGTSSAPHVHTGSSDPFHDFHQIEASSTAAGTGDRPSPEMADHDARHEHTATLVDTARPCGACRSSGERAFVRDLTGGRLFPIPTTRRAVTGRDDMQSAEHFARLHPPRAPPA